MVEEIRAYYVGIVEEAAIVHLGGFGIQRGVGPIIILEGYRMSIWGRLSAAKYRKNETIFRQGDSADAVFYILGGKCKVTVVSEKGKEAVVAVHESLRFS